jgi:choline dehydrogenase-like flavoprotein
VQLETPRDTLLSPAQRRAAIALAEAILPGSGTLPAGDESTVARVERILAHHSPKLVRGWASAVRALDAAAFARTGRRFQSLSAELQEALLADWEKSRVLQGPLHAIALLYKLVHFDAPRTYETMGGHFKVMTALDEPRWLAQVRRAAESDEGDVECDVVVIGTGAGGAVVGRELAERGHAVVFVEQGELHRRDSFSGSFVHAHTKLYRTEMALGNAPMPAFMGRLVGGSTAINGGTCIRTPRRVLDEWCERLGTDELSPEAMTPLFDHVESFLGVTEPERRYVGPIADVFDRGCAALGWSARAIRRNAVGCEGNGFCDFGCASGARRSMDISYLPAAFARGAMLFTGLRAERVVIESGRAVGIEGVDTRGRTHRVRAKRVVLAGGAIPTPLLLLKQGLCNASGQVGKNLTLHPSPGFAAHFDEPLDPHRYIPQGYLCDQFVDEGILILAAQPDHNVGHVFFPSTGQRLMRRMDELSHLAGFGLLVRDEPSGRVWFDVGAAAAITYNLTRVDAQRVKRAMVLTGEMCFAAGARRLYPGVLGVDAIETPEQLRRFAGERIAPSRFVLTSYHPLGTARMGRDPRTSVVDLDHQAHEVPGLYVVDGSTVPSAPGVNPQITIMAMATRAAAKIDRAMS